ncbi:MAG TPA: bifunctional ADP-heptose synthase [Cyclobacteriaceae bacterium]|nr:bifunctional ADP-heptose synthase [Cyclobacteriaceae bacterium]
MNSLETIFNDFNRLKILIIGDVMLDSYIWGSVDRISPEAPVPVITVKKRDYRLGGAGNVVVNVHALGATPILCSLVGNDDASVKLRSCLKSSSIREDGLVVSSSRPTTEKTRVIASHQHVVRVDEETDRPASQEEEKQIIEKASSLLNECDAIIFQDYDKGTITPNVIRTVVDLANKKGIPTIVDPKRRNFLSYEGVTLFKPNLKELREGLKLEVSNLKEVATAVEQLKAKLKAKGVMATLSEKGVYIDYKDQKIQIPAHHREIADVSGAGDTVVSIAAACVALKLDAKLIAGLSNLGGGLVCQHVGVVPINKDELLKEATVALS